MKRPEEILQDGIALCQSGNLKDGIAEFKLALEANPRPGTRMVLNHNIAYALSLLGEVQLGPGGNVKVKNSNVEYLEEAGDRWENVCKIYEQEVKGTSEEQAFSGPPSLKEYMKTALSWGFALKVKIDEFRGTGTFKK